MRLRVSDEDRGRQVRGRGETRWKQEGGASNSKIVHSVADVLVPHTLVLNLPCVMVGDM